MAISQKLLNDGETVVVDTRTHPKALLGAILWLVVVLAAAGYLQSQVDQSVVRLGIWIVALVLLVWLSLMPFLSWLTSSYTFTNRRLITRTGLITRRGHDIPLSRISDVAVELHLIDRLLGCGTLIISDASTHGQVPLHDIPHVEDTQRKLNQMLHEIHNPSPTRPVTPRDDEGA